MDEGRQRFFELTNGKCRSRLFGEADYECFADSVATAHIRAMEKEPYYAEDNAGGVANAYKYKTTTARWCVFSRPDGSVHVVLDRTPVYGRNVPCAFHNGVRGYMKTYWPGTEVYTREDSDE